MSESKKPFQMTGEEIKRTFGSREVNDLEYSRDMISGQIDALREVITEHWDDEEMMMQAQMYIDELEGRLRGLQTEIRTKRKKFSEAVENSGSVSPPL